MTADQIESALYDAYGSTQVSTIYTPTNEYWVIMELLPQYQQDPSALGLLFLKSNDGQPRSDQRRRDDVARRSGRSR